MYTFKTVVLLLGIVIGVVRGLTDCDDIRCSHKCVQVGGTAKCTCPEDMSLSSNNKTCQVPVSILLGMFRGIKMLTEKGHENDIHLVLPVRATAFDYHYANKEIYAFSNNTILKYSLNVSPNGPETPEPVITTTTLVTSLALDWVRGELYWISQQQSVLESATIKGARHRTVLTAGDVAVQTNPPGDKSKASWHNLVIDPYAEKLFWVGQGSLHSADLAGQNIKSDLGGWENVEDIALDTQNQQVYVVDEQKYVARCRYDGSQASQLFKVPHPGSTIYGFGVLGRVVYWQSNHDGENLYKAEIPASGSDAKIILVEELNQIVYDLKIYHPDIQKALK